MCLPASPGVSATPPAHWPRGLFKPGLVVYPVFELCGRNAGLQPSCAPTWPWTLLNWTCVLTFWLDFMLAVPPWTCLVVAGICLTLITFTRPDPDLWIDFLSWCWTCVNTIIYPMAWTLCFLCSYGPNCLPGAMGWRTLCCLLAVSPLWLLAQGSSWSMLCPDMVWS